MHETYKKSVEEMNKNISVGMPDGVVAEVRYFLKSHTIAMIEGEIERLNGKLTKPSINGATTDEGDELKLIGRAYEGAYNRALSDQISHLQSELLKIKGE